LGLGKESNTDPGSTSSSLLPSPGFDYQNLGIKYIVKDAAEWKHLGKQFGKQDSTTLRADLHEGATPTTPQIGRRWRQPASQKGPQIKPHVSFEQVSVETMKGMRLCFNTTSTLETVMMLINRKSSQRETAQSRYDYHKEGNGHYHCSWRWLQGIPEGPTPDLYYRRGWHWQNHTDLKLPAWHGGSRSCPRGLDPRPNWVGGVPRWWADHPRSFWGKSRYIWEL
jgi:hypothetical protein